MKSEGEPKSVEDALTNPNHLKHIQAGEDAVRAMDDPTENTLVQEAATRYLQTEVGDVIKDKKE
ncbi:hypothetical protein JXA63_01390 [Candidatus Woesebacteria bacterium]|nr:hypothetical protein [Candidatus Woesebacteria bacterium]